MIHCKMIHIYFKYCFNSILVDMAIQVSQSGVLTCTVHHMLHALVQVTVVLQALSLVALTPVMSQLHAVSCICTGIFNIE